MPSVHIHEVLNGTQVNGDLPDGELQALANGTPSYGGITQLYVNCSQAGRIEAGDTGLTLFAIGANLPGLQDFTINIVDRGSLTVSLTIPSMKILDSTIPEFVEHNIDPESFMHTFRAGVLIPPGCSLEFVAGQPTNAEGGRIYFVVGPAFSKGTGYVSINSKS